MQPVGALEPVDPSAVAASDEAETCVLFTVDDETYALRIWEVERIVRAVEVKPLPEAPPHVCGVVNVQGRILPVVDLRVRFGLPSREVRLEDHFIIASTENFSVVLPVDAALGSREIWGGAAPLEDEERLRAVRKVVPLDLGVVYFLDLERVLFGEESAEESELASVLEELQPE
jgi:purine-binding chemotaxis protein CheW